MSSSPSGDPARPSPRSTPGPANGSGARSNPAAGPGGRSGAPSRGRSRARSRATSARRVDPARRAALQALRAVDERDAYANLALPGILRRERLTGRDAAFATELAYGALRGRGTYDAVLAACTDRPLDAIDPPVLDVLRLGAHQLLATRVPAHAALDATVDLTRAEIGPGAAGFVNAVLRRVCTQGIEGWIGQVAPDPERDPDGYLEVLTSHPAWIVRALRDALTVAGRDPGELRDLLQADNVRPAVTLVALPGLSTQGELLVPGAESGLLSPLAARISGAPDELAAVREGRARVQDEGSQLVALALTAAAPAGPDGGAWLDLCAGPGGKAALLAAVLAGRRSRGELPATAELVAVEAAPARARLVGQALAAVPGAGVVREADGRQFGAAEPGRYDRVLVDVPCTGLGALRRRPEARWRRRPADLATLAPLQRELLGSALDAARPGGLVAYVTCSPHPAETRMVVQDVLRHRSDVEQLDARPAMLAASADRIEQLGDGPDVQLWPHVHGTDAMYLALLRRL